MNPADLRACDDCGRPMKRALLPANARQVVELLICPVCDPWDFERFFPEGKAPLRLAEESTDKPEEGK